MNSSRAASSTARRVVLAWCSRSGDEYFLRLLNRIIEDHFRREAEGDVEGTLMTLTEDVVHDVVGDPAGELHGPGAVGQRYGHLFSNVKGERADVKHRLYGANFVVDDKIWTARVIGEFMGIPGHGRRISIRVLHVFEFRDGLISRENVWIDAGAAITQLTSGPSTEPSGA